ncbi:MAG: hypothetical protein OXI91_11595 [Chloroflexota bacterium]|nr:hypothetical protein [Chloroflexota bacterium]
MPNHMSGGVRRVEKGEATLRKGREARRRRFQGTLPGAFPRERRAGCGRSVYDAPVDSPVAHHNPNARPAEVQHDPRAEFKH